MTIRTAGRVACVVGALLLAGCGGSDSSSDDGKDTAATSAGSTTSAQTSEPNAAEVPLDAAAVTEGTMEQLIEPANILVTLTGEDAETVVEVTPVSVEPGDPADLAALDEPTRSSFETGALYYVRYEIAYVNGAVSAVEAPFVTLSLWDDRTVPATTPVLVGQELPGCTSEAPPQPFGEGASYPICTAEVLSTHEAKPASLIYTPPGATEPTVTWPAA